MSKSSQRHEVQPKMILNLKQAIRIVDETEWNTFGVNKVIWRMLKRELNKNDIYPLYTLSY